MSDVNHFPDELMLYALSRTYKNGGGSSFNVTKLPHSLEP